VQVTIGDRTMFGPAVQVLTPMHPMAAAERRKGLEFAKPVCIGADVWVGGGAIICPGVTIGDGSVVGAGSVVTRDLPAGVFAAGNPCRVIRVLSEQGPGTE
jgi:maltose O-acetyltransferase